MPRSRAAPSLPSSPLLFSLSLSLTLSLSFLLATSPPPVCGRALWAFVDSTMGFGDKMNFYYTLLGLAHGLNRSAVLPPFQITVRDYSPLKNVDGPDDIPAALRQYTGRAEGHVSSFDLPATTHFVSAEEWINVQRLRQLTGIPLETYDAWHARTKGRVDVMVVEDVQHGCAPSWEQQCRTARKQRNVSLQRAGHDLQVAKLFCDGTVGKHRDQDSELPSNFGDILMERLKHENLLSAQTLGLDGVCLSFPKFSGHEDTEELVRKSFLYSDAVEASVRAFLQEHRIRRYVAVHWRRSDVVIDHAQYFRHHTPEAVVAGLKRSLYPMIPDPRDIDAIVLLTDNFMDKELARFKELVNAQLHVPVYRYGANDNLQLLPASPREYAQHVVVDVALGTHADYFAHSGGGSFYAHLIRRQRRTYGHVDTTATALNIPNHQKDEL